MIPGPRDIRSLLNDIISSVGPESTARRLVVFFATAVLLLGSLTVSFVIRLLSLIESVNPSTFERMPESGQQRSLRRWIVLNFSRTAS